MPDLFDMKQRAMRRDRAARSGTELFLFERTFDDCLERIASCGRTFERALLIGCPDPAWPERMRPVAAAVDVRDPGALFAARAGGDALIEDGWEPAREAYDLVLSIGTLDTINALPVALMLIRHGMASDGLFIGAVSGGETLPQLRQAMRAADAVSGLAAPHVHPRIEASAFAPLLEQAGFVRPVVDIDRVQVAYRSLDRLVADLRAMAATNILRERPGFMTKSARRAAIAAFAAAGERDRTVETFEIVHFAAWTPRAQ